MHNLMRGGGEVEPGFLNVVSMRFLLLEKDCCKRTSFLVINVENSLISCEDINLQNAFLQSYQVLRHPQS